jgi:hypothetical protein
MCTGDMSSGMPAGPLGCGGAVVVLAIVVVLAAVFVAGIWWCLRDIGAA